jgi:hypothetical protein
MSEIQINPQASEEQEDCYCFGGYVALTFEEDGEEHGELVPAELVPCSRCA